MVEATLNYLASMSEKPFNYTYQPSAGTPIRNTRPDKHTVPIHDARDSEPPPSLDREGFALVRHETKVADPFDAEAVRNVYYPEMERLVQEATGAARVVAFDHNLRSSEITDGRENLAQNPVRFAHNDYTVDSGPQRVRDLMGTEAEALLQDRFAVINVWRPIRGPVRAMPLAFCDAQGLRPDDFVATDLRYPDRTGEVYLLKFSPAQRWFYYPGMKASEALLLKCYDSSGEHARFTAHTAFEDPTTPRDAPPRESIEVRTLAFFGRPA